MTGPRPRQGADRTESAGPRREVCQRGAAARLQLFRELRRYGVERTFVHQFRLLAMTPKPADSRRTTGGVSGSRSRWQSCRTPPARPLGLAAAKHQERMQVRSAVLAEVRAAKSFPPPVRPRREAIIENVPMRLRPGRGGPMSFYELVAWHRANGTLAAFMASCGD